MNINQLLKLAGMPQTGPNAKSKDVEKADTAETLYIRALPLIKMLKHARAGIPMEVMGLMLGEYVDEYTIEVVDVFAMPQSGTSVTVESVDPVYQTKMLDLLKCTNRGEVVVGWYHSHPGFGCWLSGVDVQTQRAFEALHPRAVAVVIDPIQSVKGKVIIDAFRTIDPATAMRGDEPRQITSLVGHLHKSSIQAIVHGLGRHYYSIGIQFKMNKLEQKMLTSLNRQHWSDALQLQTTSNLCKANEETMGILVKWAKNYKKSLDDEEKMTEEQLVVKNVGKQDPKRHLEGLVTEFLSNNVVQNLVSMIDAAVFKE